VHCTALTRRYRVNKIHVNRIAVTYQVSGETELKIRSVASQGGMTPPPGRPVSRRNSIHRLSTMCSRRSSAERRRPDCSASVMSSSSSSSSCAHQKQLSARWLSLGKR